MEQKQKKILLIHRYFYPDSPTYAAILEDMRKIFLADGYKVDVLSSQPSYKSIDKEKKEKIVENREDGSTIYRLPVVSIKNRQIEKLLNYIWFPVAVFWFLLFHKRYDVMTVATTPPVVLAFLVSIIAKIKNSKLIYHFMDIHPEIGRLSGEFKNRYIFNMLVWMDKKTCKNASAIVVLSQEMKNALLQRDQTLSSKIKIINNYSLAVNTTKKSKKKYNLEDQKDKKRVIFAGNIGRFQNLDLFVKALVEFGCIDNFELVFVGEGVMLDNLKKLSEPVSECVRFVPHQPLEVAQMMIADADMGIVSLQDEVIKYAYPSKTMAYLAEGTPILVCTDQRSELSEFVETNKLGIYANNQDIKEIHTIFKKIAQNKYDFDRNFIRKIFNQVFSKEIFDKKFLELMREIN